MKILKVFEVVSMDFELTSYWDILLVYAFDCKFDGKIRAILVGNSVITIGLSKAKV